MPRYPIPANRTRVEEVILRSRFITTAAPAGTSEAARAFIASIRAEFPDATHHCYAFVAGPPGSTAQIGMSDDGEPGGTAGRPMLAVLLGSGIGDIAVVVTRYYGGTKLGTGGLVRAYSGGVKAVLDALPVCEKISPDHRARRGTLPVGHTGRTAAARLRGDAWRNRSSPPTSPGVSRSQRNGRRRWRPRWSS